jgi:hypothetical protein
MSQSGEEVAFKDPSCAPECAFRQFSLLYDPPKGLQAVACDQLEGAQSGSAFELPIHARVDPSGEETPGVVALKAGGP